MADICDEELDLFERKAQAVLAATDQRHRSKALSNFWAGTSKIKPLVSQMTDSQRARGAAIITQVHDHVFASKKAKRK